MRELDEVVGVLQDVELGESQSGHCQSVIGDLEIESRTYFPENCLAAVCLPIKGVASERGKICVASRRIAAQKPHLS
jgi:hypothetical protein